jgi:hypothetical protein
MSAPGSNPSPSARPPLPPLRDDGMPTLPTGEPVLARWFVIVMLLLVPVALGVTYLAWDASDRTPLQAVDRRPVGDATTTTDRGAALFPSDPTEEAGPGCATEVSLVGDDSARATGRRALGAMCQLLRNQDLPLAQAGLVSWTDAQPLLRVGTFERSGVDASARLEDGRIVLELNARYLFEDATRAAPVLIHQLALIGQRDWPGRPVSAQAELAATREQVRACAMLSLPGGVPRACTDAEELLGSSDVLAGLVRAGFRDADAG